MEGLLTEVIKKMIAYFDGDIKRINHALKVYSFAKSIGEIEQLPAEDEEILELSAVLHDIGIKESERKYGNSSGKYQEIEGPPVALALLSEYNLSEAALQRIKFLIGHHHSYNNIEGIDFQILIEADFLVNIFEDELMDELYSIREKYFKTKTGIALLDSMYKQSS